MAYNIYEKCSCLMTGWTTRIMSMSILYIIYLLIGSLCFIQLETKEELIERNQSIGMTNLVKAMVRSLSEKNFSHEEIYGTFSQEQSERSAKEMVDYDWSKQYSNKLFFSFVLISTIGYGNVLPHSPIGQVACIIYTFFGLALHVIMMRLLSFKFRGCLRKLLKVADHFYGNNGFALFLAGAVFFLFWAVVFIFFPGYLFTLTEGWSYNLGVYFSFASISTIGFGDYVAAVSKNHFGEKTFALNVILMLIFLFFGLGFCSMALNLFSYLLGLQILDKLDCNCKKRSVAKKKMDTLLDLIIELNWQLVKYTPDNFYKAEEIENFKIILTENPQDVDNEMINKMFKIVSELRECTYDQLSGLIESDFPDSVLIRKAKENFPDVIAVDKGSVDDERKAKFQMKEYDPEDPIEVGQITTQSSLEITESDRPNILHFSKSVPVLNPPSSDIKSSERHRRLPERRKSAEESIKKIGIDEDDGAENQTTNTDQDKTLAATKTDDGKTSEKHVEEKKENE